MLIDPRVTFPMLLFPARVERDVRACVGSENIYVDSE